MNHKSFRVISSWTATSLIDQLIIFGRSHVLRGEISTLESTGTQQRKVCVGLGRMRLQRTKCFVDF